MYTVYILQSEKTNRYYIGYTSDLDRRLKQHNSGTNSSTRNQAPWRTIYTEQFSTRGDAWLREHAVKSYKWGEAFKRLIDNK